MRRFRAYIECEGRIKTLYYGAVLAVVLHFYARGLSTPGGLLFVLLVLGLGLSLGTAIAQVMYRDIRRSVAILRITGIGLWILLVIVYVFQVNVLQVPVPNIVHLGLHIAFWMQVTAVFLVVSYEPD